MTTLTESIAIRIGADPTGLTAGIRRAESSIDAFGSRTRAVIGRMGSAIKGSADRMLTPMTAALTGGGMALAVKQINDVELGMVRLGNQAGWSSQKVTAVTNQIFASAKASGQSVDDLIDGLNKYVDQTGDGDGAIDLLNGTAKAATAVGARMTDMSTIAAQLKMNFNVAGSELGKFFEMLSVQGDKGAFTLADMSNYGTRLFSAAASGGIKKETLNSFGAMMQMARETGDAAMSVETIAATFAAFQQNAKEIKHFTGFNVFDKKGQLKDAEEILKVITKYTNGSQEKMKKFRFERESEKFFDKFQQHYIQDGNFSYFEALKNAAPEAAKMTTIQEKFNNTMKTTALQLQTGKTELLHLLAVNLAEPIEQATNALKYLNEHQKLAEDGFKAIAAAALALVAIKVGSWGLEAVKFGKELVDLGRGKGDGKKGIGGALEGLGVQKVFVTNMGGGIGGSGVPGIDSLPSSAGKNPSKLVGWLKNTFPTFTKFFAGFMNAGKWVTGGLMMFGGKIIGTAVKFVAGHASMIKSLGITGGLLAAVIFTVTELVNLAEAFNDLQKSRHSEEKVTAGMQNANAVGIRKNYGGRAADLSSQIDAIDKKLASENSSLLSNAPLVGGLFDNTEDLNKQRANLMSQFLGVIKQQNEGATGQPKILIQLQSNTTVDPTGKVSTELVTPGLPNYIRASTIPGRNL